MFSKVEKTSLHRIVIVGIIVGIILGVYVFLNGCVSSEHKVKEIDSRLEAKGQVGERTIGLDSKQELVVQEETAADDELRILENVNAAKAQDLEYEVTELRRCRLDMSDPRLGGSGEMPSLPEVDNMRTPEEVREQIGLTDDGEVKVIKKTYYIEKLKKERKYGKSIDGMVKVAKKHRAECEFRMAIARRNAGLPSTRYQGQGYFRNGQYILTHPNEDSLDRAFEIRESEKTAQGH